MPYVIYVNDLPGHRSADSLLYADVKLIAPRNCHDILQNSPNSSASWSKYWKVDLNLTKSEHRSIGNFPHFVTYTPPTHNPYQQSPPPKTWESLVLPKKPVRYRFTLNDPLRPLPPVFFSTCTTPLSDHILSMLFKQPISSYTTTQWHWKRCKSLL